MLVDRFGRWTERADSFAREAAAWFSSFANSMTASDIIKDADRWMKGTFEGAATVYSKAIDAEYLRTHIGGGWHRLFDGGHDLLGAWRAVRDAVPNDSRIDELQAYIMELWKDLVTPNGLPVITWEKASFEAFSNVLEGGLGVTPLWVRDLVSFTSTELGGGIAALAALLLNVRSNDPGKYYEICGSLGVSASIAANPIVLAVSLGALLQAVRKDLIQNINAHADARSTLLTRRGAGLLRGAIASGATIATLGFVGGFFGILAGIGVSVATHVGLKRLEERLWNHFARASTAALLVEITVAKAIPAPLPDLSVAHR